MARSPAALVRLPLPPNTVVGLDTDSEALVRLPRPSNTVVGLDTDSEALVRLPLPSNTVVGWVVADAEARDAAFCFCWCSCRMMAARRAARELDACDFTGVECVATDGIGTSCAAKTAAAVTGATKGIAESPCLRRADGRLDDRPPASRSKSRSRRATFPALNLPLNFSLLLRSTDYLLPPNRPAPGWKAASVGKIGSPPMRGVAFHGTCNFCDC